jgi:hypothetical protein
MRGWALRVKDGCAPYGFHYAPADIRLVLVDGKAVHPSSGGLSKQMRDKITASNKANDKLEATIREGASRDETQALQETTAITPSV